MIDCSLLKAGVVYIFKTEENTYVGKFAGMFDIYVWLDDAYEFGSSHETVTRCNELPVRISSILEQPEVFYKKQVF